MKYKIHSKQTAGDFLHFKTLFSVVIVIIMIELPKNNCVNKQISLVKI